MAALTRSQQVFRDELASRTGLDRRFIGAWLLAEQSNDAARYYEKKGYNNWLNVARTDSGDRGGAHGKYWSDPRTAAKVTAEWIAGKGPLARDYGKPAAGIRKILATAGKGAEAQIRALSSSGWASSGYNGGSVLRQLMGVEQGGAKNTATGSGTQGAKAPRKTTGLRTVVGSTEKFDDAGFEKASRQVALKQILERSGSMRMLQSVLPSSVDPADFTRTVENARQVRVPAPASKAPPKRSSSGSGSAGIPGVKGKGSGLFELFHGQDAWKHGQRIGAIPDHEGHVHAAAGPKTVIGLGKLAQEMGLTVRENPAFDPVDPVHTKNSYHYRRRAIDVSGSKEQMDAYTQRLRKMFGFK